MASPNSESGLMGVPGTQLQTDSVRTPSHTSPRGPRLFIADPGTTTVNNTKVPHRQVHLVAAFAPGSLGIDAAEQPNPVEAQTSV
jgi:hypothetical protein